MSLVFAMAVVALSARAQDRKEPTTFTPPEGVTHRTADLLSEGTRIRGEAFAPEGREMPRLP